MAHVGATAGATAGAGAAAAIANAIKASGVIVRVDEENFLSILHRSETPIVVVAGKPKGFWGGGYKYLTSYRGLAFFAKSTEPINLPGEAEVIHAKSIWIPG
jgi:hypothetical protein